MLEASVEHLLDAVQLRAPNVAEIVEALVEGGEASVEGLLQRRKSLINRCKPLVHANETLLHGSLYGGEPGIDICQKLIYARRSPMSPALNNIGMPIAK